MGSWITEEKHHEKPNQNYKLLIFDLLIVYGTKFLSGG